MASQVKFPETDDGLPSRGRSEFTSGRVGPEGSEVQETGGEKLWRKLKQQPLVPIGSLLTCGALIAASHHLRTGNRTEFNRALRWRVGFQGLTVAAAAAGTFYYGSGSAAQVVPSDAPGGSPEEIEERRKLMGSVSTIPGRPATVHQVERADARRAEERALLAERMREAEERERRREEEEKRAVEEALLKPGADGTAKPRPIIGRDSRRV